MTDRRKSHEIRALQEADIPVLCALARTIWRAHYPGIISTAQIEAMLAERYDETVIHAELHRKDLWWDVLWVDGTMRGYTSYFPTATPGTTKIDKLYLHPGAQRCGYGGLLIDHVAKNMIVQGCNCLTLAVNRRNKSAIAAYRKNGFRITDTSLKRIDGGFWMDDYIMCKSVNG
jgi:ribosomal protein S18 acetylase RimI-like enzyme